MATAALLAGALTSCSSATDDIGAATTTSAETSTTAPAPAQETASTRGTPSGNEEFPDIIAAQATREDGGTWRFDVTVSSPYDTPERYADAWRVLGPDDEEYGVRILTHDHANEQPFTRSQGGIDIPAQVSTVTIQGRDLANGWGGETLELVLP